MSVKIKICGDTGRTFNCNLAVEARKFWQPTFLVVGLTSAKVTDAMRKEFRQRDAQRPSLVKPQPP